MRWLALYARSRQVPAALVALVVSTVVIWLLTHRSWTLLPASLMIAATVALASIGLSGQDVELDRTAAIRWPLRRLGHLVVIGLMVAGAVLALQQAGDGLVQIGLIVRNTLGTVGLAATAATLFGGQFGWTLPLGWLAIAPFVPSRGDKVSQVVAWMLQPEGTTAATVTATALCTAGVLLYAVLGPRRA